MTFSDLLATFAIIVSITSAIFSYKAHRQTIWANERNSNLEFSREHAELLVRIEKSRKTFESASNHITSILVQIENQPEEIKLTLTGEAQQLKSNLSFLQGCLRQANSLWQETYGMNREGLAHHKPRHLALLEDDEEFTKVAVERADKIIHSLELAIAISKPLIG